MDTRIPEIGAEMLLYYLYPELEVRWKAHSDGTFYRNYSPDILSLDPDAADVSLSRDGFLDLLPQALLSPEDDLRKVNKKTSLAKRHGDLEERLKILGEAFLPFDSLAFRNRMRAERRVSELVGGKLEYLLKTYYGYDLASEENPYVRELAVLLPGARRWRGDVGLFRKLLAAMFHCRVMLYEGRYSGTDSTLDWLPAVRYELQMPDLSAEEYRTLYRDIEGLKAFLSEWFLPMDLRLEIVIRRHGDVQRLDGETLVLEYNTEL